MPDDIDILRYRWLRVLLGAIIVVAVVSCLIALLIRWTTTWSPPGVVTIPPSPIVDVSLENHPRLIATNPAIENLASAPDSPEYKRIMAKADQFYDEYLIDPLQGDTIYPGYFALAWRISAEDRYLDAARDMVFNHCSFPRWQRKPESANFYKIELAYALGLAYDLLYDQFTEKERAGIEENLSEVLDGLLWHLQGKPAPPFWHDAPHSNYYVAQHSAAGLLALCLGDAYPRWNEALAYSYSGLQPSIDLLEKDGGWIEGLTYLDFCWGQHALLFLNSLRVNNGPNRLEEDWYETSVRFALAGILPSGIEQINFGDNIKDPIASWGYVFRAKAFFDSPFLGDHIDRYLPNPDYPLVPLDALLIQAILQFDPSLPLTSFDEPEPCLYFPGIEWAILRENWTDPKCFFFATKAGYGGWDHNHVDQGTFILAFDGETFITDPGRGNFNERKNPSVNNYIAGPLGHSVFIPGTDNNACFWDDFTMYSENAQYRQTDAKIENWLDNIVNTQFTLNLDGAYPSEDVGRWHRHICWIKPYLFREDGALFILDETDTPGHIQFITPRTNIVDREGPEYTFVDSIAEQGRAELLVETVPYDGVALEGKNSNLGFLGYQPDSDVLYGIEELSDSLTDLSVLKIDNKSGDGFKWVLTILMPWDDIDPVEVKIDELPDGFVIALRNSIFTISQDNDGNWLINPGYQPIE